MPHQDVRSNQWVARHSCDINAWTLLLGRKKKRQTADSVDVAKSSVCDTQGQRSHAIEPEGVRSAVKHEGEWEEISLTLDN